MKLNLIGSDRSARSYRKGKPIVGGYNHQKKTKVWDVFLRQIPRFLYGNGGFLIRVQKMPFKRKQSQNTRGAAFHLPKKEEYQ
jgi:hypothetical protein